jgi:hypothetical protein
VFWEAATGRERPVSNSRKTPRDLLLREVEKRLLSIFIEKGFSVVPLPPKDQVPELKRAFPLGLLKRKRGTGLDIVEVQFDKRERPAFVINFATVPEEGVDLPWGGHVAQADADASSAPVSGRLYSSSWRLRWFRMGLLSPKTEKVAARLVGKAVRYSDEINDWFERGVVGRHVKTLVIDGPQHPPVEAGDAVTP